MKNMQKIYRFSLVVVALFGVAVSLSAQESKRVEVTSIYNPEVAGANKLMAPTTINDNPVIEPTIEYSVEPATWQIGLSAHNFRPATATYWDFSRSKSCFLRLGAGYPLTSDLAFRYALVSPSAGFFGVSLDHRGDFGRRINGVGEKLAMKESFNTENGIKLYGGVYVGRRLFDAKLGANFDFFKAYPDAQQSSSDLISREGVDLALRFGDSFTDLSYINFSVEAHSKLLFHSQPPVGHCNYAVDMMLTAGGSARVGREFGENRVEVNGGYDIWLNPWQDYRDSRFFVGAIYSRSFGIVDVEAGVKYMRDKVRAREKASHFVMPSAKILIDLQRAAFAPYIEFNTVVGQNGVMSLLEKNPYLDLEYGNGIKGYDAMANTRSYDLSVGFTGTAHATRLAYRAYAGVSFMRDRIYWFVTRPGYFGAHAADDTHFFAGIEVEYRPVAGLDISLGFNANTDSGNSPYLYSDPKLTADLKVQYTLKRWKFYTSGAMLGARKFSGVIGEDGKAPIAFEVGTKFDVGAGVSYRISRDFEVYADGINLLNSRLYDFAHYYRNGAGFKAGVKIHF